MSYRPNSAFITCDTSTVLYQKFHCAGTEGLRLGKEQIKINQFTSPGDLITRTKNILIAGAQTKARQGNGKPNAQCHCHRPPLDLLPGCVPPAGEGQPWRAPRPACHMRMGGEELPGCPPSWPQGSGRQGPNLVYSWLSLAPA